MNSAKLQDIRLIYRNLLFFYTLIMNYQKEKVKKTKTHVKSHQKRIKYFRNKLNQGGERPII